MRSKALTVLRAASKTSSRDHARLELIALALAGKKMSTGGFEKVIKMIDDMVQLLKEEQVGDDNKKEYCLTQFDNTDDKKKALEHKLGQVNTGIADTKDGIETTTDEIAQLTASIKALDKEVAEATQQRQDENKAFTEMMASDNAAKELLGIAKNRLNKFYNPKLYKAAPKVELSAEERILVSEGGTATPTPAPGGIAGTGVTALSQVAPPPPPATWDAYAKKSGESTGVIAMIDLLIKDLTKEMTEGKTAEADAQADYENMMRDSAEKRVADSQALSDKTAQKAALEQDLAALNDEHAATTSELAATLEYISSLHAECDWLLKYFDVRKEARNGEIDSLRNAKAVLSGADYSFIQRSTVHKHAGLLPYTQSVKIDGADVTSQLNQCVAFSEGTVQDASRPRIEVCGTGIQVQVNLLNRCKDYWTYQHTIGDCNSGQSSSTCVTADPSTVAWLQTAQSYKITQC